MNARTSILFFVLLGIVLPQPGEADICKVGLRGEIAMKESFDQIQSLLRQTRYTSQFLLSQIKDFEAFHRYAREGRIFVSKKNDFIAYVSPGKILHIQGKWDSANEKDLIQLLHRWNPKGINGPTSIVNSMSTIPAIAEQKPRAIQDLVYTLPLPAEIVRTGRGRARRLTPADFDDWLALYVEYLKELDLASTLTTEERKEKFEREASNGWHWGTYDEKGKLISIAAYNARGVDEAQIGGVYTVPSHRGKGYARSAMEQLIADSNSSGLKELILFTGPINTAPGRLYYGLGFRPIDEYSMTLFDKPRIFETETNRN